MPAPPSAPSLCMGDVAVRPRALALLALLSAELVRAGLLRACCNAGAAWPSASGAPAADALGWL